MSRPEEDEALAAFQEALLAYLAEPDVGADERVRRLAADPRSAPFVEYVARFDGRCVEVTALLMARWGARDES